ADTLLAVMTLYHSGDPGAGGEKVRHSPTSRPSTLRSLHFTSPGACQCLISPVDTIVTRPPPPVGDRCEPIRRQRRTPPPLRRGWAQVRSTRPRSSSFG